MLYLTCTMIFSVDLAHYGVSRVKDWVFGDRGTMTFAKTEDLEMWPKHKKSLFLDCGKELLI